MNQTSPRHPAGLPPLELLADVRERRGRRSGPGGQHRNKVETAVMLEHSSGVRAEASERRSQQRNREVALFRLRVKLAIQIRVAWGDTRRPSQLWLSRCRGGRLSVSPTHDDFPALLAEALDALDHFQFEVKTAAAALSCTTSQLTRFLKLDGGGWEMVTRRRAELGLRPLR